jgi:hypothetical protein
MCSGESLRNTRTPRARSYFSPHQPNPFAATVEQEMELSDHKLAAAPTPSFRQAAMASPSLGFPAPSSGTSRLRDQTRLRSPHGPLGGSAFGPCRDPANLGHTQWLSRQKQLVSIAVLRLRFRLHETRILTRILDLFIAACLCRSLDHTASLERHGSISG